MFTGTADEEQASGEIRSELLGRLAYTAVDHDGGGQCGS